MRLKEIVNSEIEGDNYLISKETYGVFLSQDIKTSQKVYDEFSKQVTREVGFRQI